MRGRLSPYIFFLLAAGAFAMIAVQGEESLTEPVDPLRAVLIVVGVFAGAHILRALVARLFGRDENRR